MRCRRMPPAPIPLPPVPTLPAPLSVPQRAQARLRIGKVRAAAAVEMTPAGLLAVGGLVAAILWSVPPILRAARERPGR